MVMIAEVPTGDIHAVGSNSYFDSMYAGTTRTELSVDRTSVPHLQEPQVIRTADDSEWSYSKENRTLSPRWSNLDISSFAVFAESETMPSSELHAKAETMTQLNLKKIRSTFGLNKSELASALKSTRMTVDGWLDGATPNKTKRQRVLDLIDIADAWVFGGYPMNTDVLKVKQFRGESLLDMLMSERLDRDKILFFGTSQLLERIDDAEVIEDPFA